MSIHQDQPQNKLEWLLASRGSGAGMIAASASQSHPPKILRVAAFDDLAVLMEAAREIEQGSFDSTAFPPELIKLLQHGSSMGGARPKVTVEKYGREWIAKFSRNDDVFNQVCAEKACMEMARSAGCQVPELSLVDISGHTALLIERFDRSNDGRRLHYLSANAILNIHKARPDDERIGYPYLSGVLQKLSCQLPEDQHELFTRMVLNIMMGNTDDHLKNHGFLRGFDGRYRLSPLFDVLPHPSQLGMLAMRVGMSGHEATLCNAMSVMSSFGVDDDKAIASIQKCADTLSDCEVYFSEAGMSNNDIQLLTRVCQRTLNEANAIVAKRVTPPGRETNAAPE